MVGGGHDMVIMGSRHLEEQMIRSRSVDSIEANSCSCKPHNQIYINVAKDASPPNPVSQSAARPHTLKEFTLPRDSRGIIFIEVHGCTDPCVNSTS